MNDHHAGKLDRRVQFVRAVLNDDGFQKVEQFADHGDLIWASKTDVSDGERMSAGAVSASLTARFVVCSSAFTRDLTAKDALTYNGVTFAIFGIKEIGRNYRLEITAGAEVSNGNG
ncbi:head-tail adaptor protein [Loktanella sp. D2R18]|uniref:phage head closure protein n=1 Tax=Rhodobacterales TaxID=204455 RepID=UPI000DE8AE1A|nr:MULTISPECIES: phage head closure protein [Rhodobacterales]MDO6589446.1 phage head closure protein [Yoonia sp. 1_MG-2023]RBW44097.1 head-tail adaptor protein [Loktanella sp. D2R18]